MTESSQYPAWLPLWRTAFLRNARQRYVQLATVSPEGLPEVRTVVLRGLADDGAPYLFTDARAHKYTSLEQQATAELHVYWSKTKEQFRLQGSIILADAVHLASDVWQACRQKMWDKLNHDGRALLLGPAPATPLADLIEDLPSADSDVEALGKLYDRLETHQTTPPATFALIAVQPARVDYLKLGRPQIRARYELEADTWQGGEVVP
ncbi:MAG: pyridoxamine 5'-phosphate oxidase family protein [Deinococcota bacterium]